MRRQEQGERQPLLVQDEDEQKGKRYYTKSVEEIVEYLKTNVKQGLSTHEAEKRLKKYGKNELPKPPSTSLFKIFVRQLFDFMVIILFVAGIVSFAIKDFIEGAVLLAVVVTNVTIGVVEEYKAEKALAELQQLSIPTAQVLRDGER